MTTNRPVAFQGTKEEAEANYRTHRFTSWGDEQECMECYCKPWHQAAKYPCGVEPPRETVEDEYAALEQFSRFLSYNLAEAEDH